MSATIDFSAAKSAISLHRIVGETLALSKDGKLFVGLCPFHTEKTASFVVFPDHYHCFGCGARGDAIDWLTRQRGMSMHEAAAYIGAGGSGVVLDAPVPARRSVARSDDNTPIAWRIWREATAPHGTLVQTYLASRGLALPGSDVIRFHPRCPWGRHTLPAMLALMSDPLTGEPRGIHRTFLRPDGAGKAEIPTPKMMLGIGGVIRLYERLTAGIAITEGIETALAVAQHFRWGPVWAAGSKGAIRTFPVLPATTLNVFTDNDDPDAVNAAQDCAARWVEAGHQVVIHTPPAGTDWADVAESITP